MRKPVIVFSGLALAVLAVGGGVAFAEQHEAAPASPAPAATASPAPRGDDDAAPAVKPAVLAEQAQKTALSQVSGGWIVSSELETEGAAATWEVEVADGKGAERTIAVDAATGKIVPVAADTEDDGQEGAEQESGEPDDD
ncbi:peptidase propeptide and YPEB domain protein [Planomonospora sphaerica]|uniref:Peptidase propeptide and YPEB domain protein n=1 Tax=Planomonospora sphaerica TaxID=161355 RepID=A0A161MD44_9ACTN|nr:PepSY domain-containing protein [Planomonospora sphaerica]GAT69373.1 peptidase propeptide and YPEB domain protein [Planomonospora sphaerica]